MAWLEPDICDIDIHVVRWDVYSTRRQHAEYVMGIYQLYAAGVRKANNMKPHYTIVMGKGWKIFELEFLCVVEDMYLVV